MNRNPWNEHAVQPHEYPRRILLAVTGLSPQVVTESVYALAKTVNPAFVPTEVHIITTRAGADHARLNLLSDDPGWFHRLLRDYALPPVAFDVGHIHIIPNATAHPAEDIRSPEDNEAAADFITETVRRLTEDEAAALHVSIAGGRKTMGFYLGYGLSLFGRPQDRLSHVLVSPLFESHPLFYYPTPYERVIHTQDKSQLALDTCRAEVTLAEIPFVRLRERILPDRLLEGRATYSETVAAVNRTLGPPELVIDLRDRILYAGGIEVRLPPVDLAFYSWFARRRVANKDPIPCPKEGVPEPEYAQAFLSEYRAIIGPMGDDDRTSKCLSRGMDKMFFLERKSDVNKKMRAILGPHADTYLIRKYGRKPRTRFGAGLEARVIRFGTAME